ncbi:MAG: calcium/sodium antiporter [Bacilli bacterium]|nr:calcium/sodium antiporter [Bacilli bacterium]
MIILLQIVLICVGFFLLCKGADLLVDGASSLALNFKLPKLLIGLTIVAFGTSLPELAVAFKSIYEGSPDIAFGNTIGSGITNILLILGISAIIRPIKIKEKTIYAELPIMLLITLTFTTLLCDIFLQNNNINIFSRSDAIVIILTFGVFINYLLRESIKKKEKIKEKPDYKISTSFILMIIGLISLVVGSDLVVDSVEYIGNMFNISERIISLTVVTFGTSLPEMITAIVASRKNESELILGNILGSNIFNICVVIGFPILLYGNVPNITVNLLDIVMDILTAFLLFIFCYFDRVISKVNGYIMVFLFFVYYTIILFI